MNGYSTSGARGGYESSYRSGYGTHGTSDPSMAVSLDMTTYAPLPWEVDNEEMEIIEHFFSKELRDLKVEGLIVDKGRKCTLKFPEKKVTYEVKTLFEKLESLFWGLAQKSFLLSSGSQKSTLKGKCKSRFLRIFISDKNDGWLRLFSKSEYEVKEAIKFLDEEDEKLKTSSLSPHLYSGQTSDHSSRHHMSYSVSPWYITKEQIETIDHFFSKKLKDLERDGFILDKGQGCLRHVSGMQQVSSDVKEKLESLKANIRNLEEDFFYPGDKSMISHLWNACLNKFPSVLVIVGSIRFEIIAKTREEVREVRQFLEEEEKREKSLNASAEKDHKVVLQHSKSGGEIKQQRNSKGDSEHWEKFHDVTKEVEVGHKSSDSTIPLHSSSSLKAEDKVPRFSSHNAPIMHATEVNFDFHTNNGIKVRVYEGDLLRARADCIVNAANVDLQNNAGVAFAISKVCGADFERECSKLVKRLGSLKVAEVQATSAGFLSSEFKAVLHAVGPCWGYYRNKEKCLDDLQQTWQNILQTTNKQGFHSVAVPLISSGIFSVPKHHCAEMCLYGLFEYFDKHPTSSIQEVHIVDKNPSVLRELERTYSEINKRGDHRFLQPRHNTNSSVQQVSSMSSRGDPGAHGGRDDTKAKEHQYRGISLFREPDCKITGISDPVKVKVFKTETGVTIKVYTGSLVRFKGDAIVSSADERLSGIGPLASAIETAGGSRYKESFNKMRSSCHLYSSAQKLPAGIVLTCSGGNLPVKDVFHVVIQTLVTTYEHSLKEYGDTLRKIFGDLLGRKVTKFAMPLIGAGGLFNEDLKTCCGRMVSAMMDALTSCRSTSVKEIHLINKNTAVSPSLVNCLIEYVTSAAPPHHNAKSDMSGARSSSYRSGDKASGAVHDEGKSSHRGKDSHTDLPSHRHTDRHTDGHHNRMGRSHADCKRDRSPKKSPREMDRLEEHQLRNGSKHDQRPHTAGGRHNFTHRSQGSRNAESQYSRKQSANYKDQGARPKHNNTAVYGNGGDDVDIGLLLDNVSTSTTKSKSGNVEMNSGSENSSRQTGNLAIIGDSDEELEEKKGEDPEFQGGGYDTEEVKMNGASGRYKEDQRDEDAQCVICMDTITDSKRLDCGHEFCSDCIKNAFSHKPVCPMCGKVFAALKGNQPENGEMRTFTEHSSLPGYNGCGTIVIDYKFSDGIQKADHPNPGKRYKGTNRRAYLPDNEEGRKVLRLLRKAFDQRLTFTIGSSRTTGQEDVVTWNDIHHKTKRDTGAQRFGYPDATYLQRVQEELAAKGITD